MFVVRPIQDKSLQNKICAELSANCFDNSLAFYAADLKENGTDIDSYISICQFYFKGDAEIIDMTVADGREEDEAVIVMLRAVMSFMHRCGAKMAYFADGAASEFWLKKSGFSKEDGLYKIDLIKFYNAPCKYSEEN